jgi:hypothetical protein
MPFMLVSVVVQMIACGVPVFAPRVGVGAFVPRARVVVLALVAFAVVGSPGIDFVAALYRESTDAIDNMVFLENELPAYPFDYTYNGAPPGQARQHHSLAWASVVLVLTVVAVVAAVLVVVAVVVLLRRRWCWFHNVLGEDWIVAPIACE